MKTLFPRPAVLSLLFTVFTVLQPFLVWAQNCTINAGIDQTVCAASSVIQQGNIGGSFVDGTIVWSQLSGPNTAAISNTASLSPTFSNLVAGTYVFQIQATCQLGGNATDQCTITVQAGATAVTPSFVNAGCYTPGTPIALTGSAPPGHTLTWSITNNTLATGGTFNGATSTSATGNNPTVQFSAPAAATCGGGTSIATISVVSSNGSTGCSETRTFPVYYSIRPATVTATADPSAVCGTCTRLTGSCATGGAGAWTVISTPVAAPAVTFSPNTTTSVVNACNLVPGNYTFRWTVTGGACTTGFADVTISVSPFTSISVPVANSKRFCAGTLPSTVSLEGNVPVTGESVSWTQVSGPAVAISNPNSPHAQATGLTEGGAPYIFKYTISNGGCSLSDTMMISISRSLSFQPASYGYCFYSSQPQITSRVTVIPFMQADSIPVSLIYEAGPATNMQVYFEARMFTQDGTATSLYYYSPAINIVRGGTASYTYRASTLWPTYNQYYAEVTAWIYTNNNLPSCNYILPGIYRFRTATKDDCGTFMSNPFEHSTSSVVTFNAGSDQMLPCGNTSTTLAGNLVRCDVTPFWRTIRKPAAAPDPVNAGNMYNPNAVLTGLQNGSYVFVWSSNDVFSGCPVRSDSVRITVSAIPPAVPVVSGGGTYCISTPVTVSGALNDDAFGGTWTVSSVPLGGAFTITPSVNSPDIIFTPGTANTVYTLTWTVINGCGSAAASVNVTTGGVSGIVPDISNTGNCSMFGAFGTLSATPAGGVWTSSNPNYTLSTPSASTTTVVPSSYSDAQGGVVFYYTITNSCGSFADSVVFVSFSTPLLSGGTFCNVSSFPSTQSVTLTNILPNTAYAITGISGPGTATVSPMTFVATGVTQSLNISASQSGQYTIGIRQLMGACNNATSFTVRFSSQPPTAIAGPDINLCGSTNFTTLHAQPDPLGANSGTWSLETVYNGFAPQINNAVSATPTLTFNNGGGDVLMRWTVTGENAACANGTQDYVRVRYVPAANAGQDDFTCYDASGSPATMVLNANNNTAGTGSWSIINKPPAATPSFINSSLPNTSVTNLINGGYTFRWTITDPAGVCPATYDEVNLLVYFGCVMLDVELKSFSAQKSGHDVQVSWELTSDETGARYVVERGFSATGSFQSISWTDADMMKNGRYTILDKDILRTNSRVYYRLKMLSKTGKVSYSRVALVTGSATSAGLAVTPTLVHKGDRINISAATTAGTVISWTVYSVSGQVVTVGQTGNTGRASFASDRLIPGVYLVKVNTVENSAIFRIVVE